MNDAVSMLDTRRRTQTISDGFPIELDRRIVTARAAGMEMRLEMISTSVYPVGCQALLKSHGPTLEALSDDDSLSTSRLSSFVWYPSEFLHLLYAAKDVSSAI